MRNTRHWLLFLLFIPASVAWSADARRCALITDTASAPLGILLQDKLQKSAGMTWVERQEISRVLKEQQLAAALGAKGGPGRVKLGQILKADFLVILRQNPADKTSELTVCETTRGLRLAVTRSAANPKADRNDAALLAAVEPAVLQALRKGKEPIRDVVSVPPFVSGDLGYRYEAMKGVYAKLVEEALLSMPGIVVVELEEAQAVAQEIALTGGDKVKRPLPLFLAGEFRNQTDTKSNPLVSVTLTARRGEKQVEQAALPPLTPTAAGPALRKAVNDIAAKVLNTQVGAPAQEVEAKQLLDRSREFSKLGNWKEALDLAEASLLLVDSTEARHDAVVGCTRMSGEAIWIPGLGDGGETPEMASRSIAYHLRGLEHLEVMLQTLPNFNAYSRPGGSDFAWDHYNSLILGLPGHPRKDTLEALAAGRDQAAEVYLRIARMRARDKRNDDWLFVNFATRGLSDAKHIEIALKFIEECKDLPGSGHRIPRLLARDGKPPLDETTERDVVARLMAIDNREVKMHAENFRKMNAFNRASLEQARALKNTPAKPAADASATRPAGPAEVTFDPVKLKVVPAPQEPPEFHTIRCLPAGKGIDAFWSLDVLYLMKTRGELRPLWAGSDPNDEVASVVFDGKFLWIPVTRHQKSAQLFVADPVTGRVTELTKAHGLPLDAGGPEALNHNQFVRVAPIAPGHAIVCGTFGRTWMAEVKLNPGGKPAAKVFLEAREIGEETKADQWKQTNVTFEPAWMFVLTNPKDPADRRVIVGRGMSSIAVTQHPLMVNVKDLGVSVIQAEGYYAESSPSDFGSSQVVTATGDAMWWTHPTRKWSTDPPRPSVYRMGFPDFKKETIAPSAHGGEEAMMRDRLFTYQGRWFIAARDWWTADAPAGPFRQLSGDDPERLKPGTDKYIEYLDAICPSNHYGLLAIGQKDGGTIYEVKFTAKK